ncbi:hypothetical protein [Roseimarinus sediminis]|uniref:hypothetical protein n=1 Tax=Roseimarinus sediminis TaxID=1610899 RepID=UPI003D1D63F3
MKYLISLLLISLCFAVNAQDRDEIIKKGIEVKRYYEQELEDGDSDYYLFKEEHFNFKGEIVELKEFNNKGKDVDIWFKYQYDEIGQLIEELELDAKGNQKERIVYRYEKGLRIEKLYYDEKDRLRQRRKYEYEFRR